MGKGRPRAVEKGKRGGSNSSASSYSSLNLPPAPVYYPTEEEFKDPLNYIDKIRPEAELYGICRIVPPHSWKPPFALDLDSFTFPTKTQAIHQLQLRPACDSKTFELEYNRFLKEHCCKKSNKRVVFDGNDLDLCKLFNAVKRYGGYEKVVKEKKWGDVFRFLSLDRKISECAKHVLCQIYREHLFDYEGYYNQLDVDVTGKYERILEEKVNDRGDVKSCKRRRINVDNEIVKACSNGKIGDLENHDQICEQCKIGSHGEVMLLCDRCNKGWHIYCLSPPLMGIPPRNWYCLECLNSDKDRFGFTAGKCFSLEAFRRVAERSKKKWFGSMPFSLEQIEKKFWEVVEGLIGEVEVMYGSDLDTSVYGSGFPRAGDRRPQSVEAELWDIYCSSPWNLNNLPKLRGSMLRAVRQNIAGVMVPWLYIGMLFSSFCWHFEDHCFYSMNYLHWGEPKCWYSVPGNEAYAFEKVMRSNLPDLFDAQPDLLFQLVTMLNPSVLQNDNVPVYSLVQEPGNFVITFPRSYHGGFNLGLNCAEAVNFAPADWLPHGGIGAGLYQLYHKPAVLSHEELLCVVAKSDFDSKASTYLKKELFRIYTKEKILREKLWRSGIVNSSPMTVRKNVEFVDTEEDPTCIICQQYLYLSAAACCCRPSAFACLEHWEHICECEPSKHHFLYRYTLAELNDLVLLTYKFDFVKTPKNQNLELQLSRSNDSDALTKKVKGIQISHVELAKDWIVHSHNLFQMPFSSTAVANALKEAEQFIWAGSEMNLVRDIVKNLIHAKEWAEDIRSCVSKVENWLSNRCPHSEKVQFKYVDKLLSLNPRPCNESGHLKLKEHLEVARLLIHEIDSALSNCSEILSLEILFKKTIDLPILLEESERLEHKISFAKVCRDNVRSCILESGPSAIDVDMLYKLKMEILELQIILPEADLILDLLQQFESCRVQCSDVLGAPMSLKNIEEFLQQFDGFTINVPELKLLRQYYCDTVSWTSRFENIIANVHEGINHENIVHELNGLVKAGASLRIRVDELSYVEVELKKASCRERAHKILYACDSKMSLHIIQHLLMEAVMLEIDHEKQFLHISGVLEVVICWEDKALHVLANESQISDFEDLIRASDSIYAILPSLSNLKDAVLMANSWLEKSKPYLAPFSWAPTSNSLLNVDALKELESESKLLKVSLAERSKLQIIMQNCIDWEQNTRSLLENAKGLFQLCNIENEAFSELIKKIECLLADVDSLKKHSFSLGYDFVELPQLHTLHFTLQWCFQALSLRSNFPSLQEVEQLAEVIENLPITWISSFLVSSLIDGVRWMRKASEIVVPFGVRKFKLTDAEDVLAQSQILKVIFPEMFSQLVNVIKKHNVWLEQVHNFSNSKLDDKPLSILLQLQGMRPLFLSPILEDGDVSGTGTPRILQGMCPRGTFILAYASFLRLLVDIGKLDAFDCPELNVVSYEAERVEKWKVRCLGIVSHFVGNMNSLLSALTELKHTLDKSLIIYDMSKHDKIISYCICCYSDCNTEDSLTCLICKDCYHWHCLKPNGDDLNNLERYTCPYCLFVSTGSVIQNGGLLKFKEKRCELKILAELLADALDFHIQLEERVILSKIVEQTLACSDCLIEMADFSLCFQDKDISITFKILSTALKAVGASSVYDQQAYRKLDVALARNAWKVRADRQFKGSRKPSIQQIQRLLKDGEALNIPTEDHFWQKLTSVRHIGLQWADTAKKVTSDSGELELEKVFELIMKGENLDVHFEKELKLLRTRSMLYCICRKPYDLRAMIACDQCDEWYHFDCVKMSSAPKIYICPACMPRTQLSTLPLENNQRSFDGYFNGKARRSSRRGEVKVKNRKGSEEEFLNLSGLWTNRKPFRRNAKKRVELQCLVPLGSKWV